ncbi:cytidylyltransferase domain-containing protein [Bradyrhizobium sp. CCBAU 53338]|uniref:cytidylyltransferase domain-containing protein n=1 Tax=Bradyrhizobium sp. CCBAU 53338 TaxID=1325111 RepID=UPI00188C46A4|nr:glycosyltransferase family protein [Bradyrhizobium sp. CCBAU 53338]QOZ52003.1 spore coat protein [Bradyrhizobium sp. CCBAU 53338]
MILAILQARMSSTRLPGKVLKPILGRPMLCWQIDRIRRSRTIERLVVATSQETSDDPIQAFCDANQVFCYRGALHDVLGRFHGAAQMFGPAEHVIRLTGDCPLIDWTIIDAAVDLQRRAKSDLAGNGIERTYPDGLDVEVVAFSALERAHREATDASAREHVTHYIYRHPETFRLAHLTQEPDLGALRWTVDTPADFEMVEKVFKGLAKRNNNFIQQDVLDFLEGHPEIVAINAP